jgi:hypothetical protein
MTWVAASKMPVAALVQRKRLFIWCGAVDGFAYKPMSEEMLAA